MTAMTDTSAITGANPKGGVSPKGVANAMLTVELVVLAVLCAALFAGLPFGIKAFGVMSGSMEPGYPAASVDAIEAKVASGAVSEERIDESVRRIFETESKLGLLDDALAERGLS